VVIDTSFDLYTFEPLERPIRALIALAVLQRGLIVDAENNDEMKINTIL